MAAQVSALSERLLTNVTLEGAHISVLAEVVPQVAALAKESIAVGDLAAEVELDALRVLVVHLHYFVPVRGNTIKLFLKI